jgi:hypothetical protein
VYAFTVTKQLPVPPGRCICGHQSRKPREWDDDPAAVCQVDAQLIIRELDPASEWAQFRA